MILAAVVHTWLNSRRRVEQMRSFCVRLIFWRFSRGVSARAASGRVLSIRAGDLKDFQPANGLLVRGAYEEIGRPAPEAETSVIIMSGRGAPCGPRCFWARLGIE